MRNLFFLVNIFTVILECPAQPSIQWQYCFGGSDFDEATSVQVLQDSCLIVAGVSQSIDGDVIGVKGNSDFWILKTESSGQIVWSRCFGGSGHEKPYNIEQTSDNGFVIAGFTRSNDGDVIGQHGDYDVWVIKLDSMGEMQWQKCLGGEGYEEAWDICQTKDGGYVITGRSGEASGDVTENHGMADCWVVKLSSEGTIIWQRSLGGSKFDIGYSIQQTHDDGFIVAGESQSDDGDVTQNYGNSDYWIVKLNFEGKVEWENSFGGTALDRANEIQQTSDKGYLVFGQARSSNGQVSGNHGGFDQWLIKLDSIGNMQWAKTYGGTSEDFGRSFFQKSNGNIVAMGIVLSNDGDVTANHGGFDIWIFETSSLGELIWQKAMGGNLDELGYFIAKIKDDVFVLAGGTRSNNGDVSGNQGASDYWIVKLSAPSSSTSAPAPASLMLAPNPARDRIQLLGPPMESDTRVRIIDALGRVHTDARLEASGSLDVSGLPRGVYWVEALGAVGKLVKE